MDLRSSDFCESASLSRFLCGLNSCSCCGKPVPDSQKVVLKDMLASATAHKLFRLEAVQEDLANTVFKDTNLSMSFVFQRFLRMSLNERCYTSCPSVFQIVYGVFKYKDSLLNFDPEITTCVMPGVLI